MSSGSGLAEEALVHDDVDDAEQQPRRTRISRAGRSATQVEEPADALESWDQSHMITTAPTSRGNQVADQIHRPTAGRPQDEVADDGQVHQGEGEQGAEVDHREDGVEVRVQPAGSRRRR